MKEAKSSLRSSEACLLTKLATNDTSMAWDALHTKRYQFCEMLNKMLLFLFPLFSHDVFPIDEDLNKFIHCYQPGVDDKDFLGDVDKSVWEKVAAGIFAGMSTMWSLVLVLM